MIFAILYAIWCGFCWVLRGGKFGDIFRRLFERGPGTQLTRICSALLMVIPLGFLDPAYLIAWPFVWAAMTIGYFDESMGLEEPGRDHFFLAAWGAANALVMALPIWHLGDPSFWFLLGAGAVAAYAANKPFGRRWNTDWTERAEACTGFLFGLAIALAL